MKRQCAKGWEWSDSRNRCVPENEEGGKNCLEKLEAQAKKMVEGGASAPFHEILPSGRVSPSATFVVPKEMYERYGVTEDYPFVEIQIVGVPIEEWAKEVYIEQPYLLYLGLNQMNDMHNAVSDALNLNGAEFGNLMDKGIELSSLDISIRKFKNDYNKDRIQPLSWDSEHGDYWYSWGKKSEDERCRMGKELMKGWKEAEMRSKGQKSLKEYKR